MPNAQRFVHLDLLHLKFFDCSILTFVQRVRSSRFWWYDAVDLCVHAYEILAVVTNHLKQWQLTLLLGHPMTVDTVQLIRQDHELEFDHRWKKMHLLHGVEFDNEILRPNDMGILYNKYGFEYKGFKKRCPQSMLLTLFNTERT